MSAVKTDPARVLVGIPALNEAGHIEACIRSLAGGDASMRGVRMVVADGGSQDKTREIVTGLMAEFPDLELIDNPRRLQAAALNLVAEGATPEHEVLVRCDAHAVYPPGYVMAVAGSLLSRPDAASLATPMDARGKGCFQKAAAFIVDTPLGSGGSAHRGGTKSGWVDHGHHAGFRLDWFRKIGGYDPDFSHNEDAEYDHRLGLAGGRVWLDGNIRLDYYMRDSLSGLARQYRNYGSGRARTVLKHRMKPRLRQMIPVINLVGLLGCFLLALFHPVFLAGPLAYLGMLGLVGLGIALKHRSLCGLWAGPALAAIHLAWGAGFLWQVARSGGRK